MPLYTFRCTNCNHEYEHSCKISERDEVLQGSCPQCSQPKKLKQIITKAPMVADPVAMGVTKVPLEFKEKVLDKAFDKSMGKTYNETKFTREVAS